MAETTLNLALPLLAAAQAQKHVTHNEALVLLDALVQIACRDKDLTSPPAAPAEGDRYLVTAASPTGAWAALSGQIACFRDGVWIGLAPRAGWLAWVADEAEVYVFTGTAWTTLRETLRSLANLTGLGVNTAADAGNRLAVKADGALFSWDDVTPGSGHMRLTVNKHLAGQDAGLILQTGYSTRATFGTFGADDVVLKVSPDGASFLPALTAKASNGWIGLNGATPLAPLHVLLPFRNGMTINEIFYFESYGGDAAGSNSAANVVKGTISRGTVAAPLGIKGTDRFFGFFGAGRRSDGALSNNCVAFTATAEEDFGPAAWGTLLDFQTTNLGSTTRRSVMKLRGNGALELVAQAGVPGVGLAAGQLVYDGTAGAFRGYDGSKWVRLTNRIAFAASAGADTALTAGTWTRVAFTTAEANDQTAYVPATSRFVAPEAGLYRLSASLPYKRSGTNAPTAFEAQFYRNGAAAGRGRAGASQPVDALTSLTLTGVLKLAAGEYVEIFARLTGADGFVAAADAQFAGHAVG